MKINSVSGVNTPINPIGERVVETESFKEVKPLVKPERAKNEVKKSESSDKDSNESGEVFNDELIKKSVDQANKTLEMYHRRIDRTVHEVTKAIIYTIRDTETNEVIQEFPPRKLQDMIAKMWELAGLFVDEKA